MTRASRHGSPAVSLFLEYCPPPSPPSPPFALSTLVLCAVYGLVGSRCPGAYTPLSVPQNVVKYLFCTACSSRFLVVAVVGKSLPAVYGNIEAFRMRNVASFTSRTHSRMFIYIRVLGFMSSVLSSRDGAVMRDLPEQVSTLWNGDKDT